MQKEPQSARSLAQKLWEAQHSPAALRAPEVRAAIIHALGPIADDTDLKLQKLLPLSENSQEPVRVRVAALQALGETRNDLLADRIARDLLAEPKVDIRIAALEAIARAGSFEANAQVLYNLTRPDNEANEQVRKAAWDQFKNLLHTATNLESLKNWSSQMRTNGNIEQQIEIQKTLVQRLQQAGMPGELALEQQNLGAAYLQIRDFKDAIQPLREAMSYWNGRPGMVAAQLVNQLMDALLGDGRYADACTFAGEQIREKSNAREVQAKIFNYANALRDSGIKQGDARKLADVVSLVNEALKLDLEKQFKKDLEDFERDAKRTLESLPRTAALESPSRCVIPYGGWDRRISLSSYF
jgi:tetratricopeptide (TPR) repeat protein